MLIRELSYIETLFLNFYCSHAQLKFAISGFSVLAHTCIWTLPSPWHHKMSSLEAMPLALHREV